MTQEQIEYGERFAYKDIAEYEAVVGHTVNGAFSMGWDMARTKNKHLGIFKPDKTTDTEEP